MKKPNKLLIVFGIVAALAIGFLIGISVEHPRINLGEVSGTIGKVDNYRNTKATEADIELKNELLADTVMLKSVKNYMNFFYVRSIEFGKNIDFAVSVANANETFKTKCGTQIASLESYGSFLNTARKDLLMAAAACQSAEKADPALLHSSIAQANNIVAQMNYRNSAVINFIIELDSFIQEKGTDEYPELNKAHDLLSYNEIGSSILLKDKVTLNFFDKKKFYCKDLKSSAPSDFKENIQKDMEQLGMFDAEKLGYHDAEQLGLIFGDIEKLGSFFDSEKLGYFDAEKLGSFFDSEVLGYW